MWLFIVVKYLLVMVNCVIMFVLYFFMFSGIKVVIKVKLLVFNSMGLIFVVILLLMVKIILLGILGLVFNLIGVLVR